MRFFLNPFCVPLLRRRPHFVFPPSVGSQAIDQVPEVGKFVSHDRLATGSKPDCLVSVSRTPSSTLRPHQPSPPHHHLFPPPWLPLTSRPLLSFFLFILFPSFVSPPFLSHREAGRHTRSLTHSKLDARSFAAPHTPPLYLSIISHSHTLSLLRDL